MKRCVWLPFSAEILVPRHSKMYHIKLKMITCLCSPYVSLHVIRLMGVLLLWNMTPCHCVTVFKKMLWSQKIRKSLPSVGITSQKNRTLSDAATKICNHGYCLLFVEFICLLSHFEITVLTLDCCSCFLFLTYGWPLHRKHVQLTLSIWSIFHWNGYTSKKSMANFTHLNTFLWNSYQLLSKQTFTMLVRWSQMLPFERSTPNGFDAFLLK